MGRFLLKFEVLQISRTSQLLPQTNLTVFKLPAEQVLKALETLQQKDRHLQGFSRTKPKKALKPALQSCPS